MLELLSHPAIPVLTFFLGLVLGHWLSLGRDRRKEYNDALEPVRALILDISRCPSPNSKRPSATQLDALEGRMGVLRRKRWRVSWENLLTQLRATEQDAAGQPLLRSPEAAQKAAEKCLTQLKLKR